MACYSICTQTFDIGDEPKAKAFKLLGLTPLEIFQAARSISLGVAAKAKAESGRREL